MCVQSLMAALRSKLVPLIEPARSNPDGPEFQELKVTSVNVSQHELSMMHLHAAAAAAAVHVHVASGERLCQIWRKQPHTLPVQQAVLRDVIKHAWGCGMLPCSSLQHHRWLIDSFAGIDATQGL